MKDLANEIADCIYNTGLTHAEAVEYLTDVLEENFGSDKPRTTINETEDSLGDGDDFTEWLEYQFTQLTTGVQYCDNFRVAKVGDDEQEKAYDEARANGCCGYCDVTRNYKGEPYRLGFNYGH